MVPFVSMCFVLRSADEEYVIVKSLPVGYPGFCRMKQLGVPPPPGGGEGYSIYPLEGRCGRAPHTLTLFKTNIADFPTLFKTEFRFLIPCLRHLTRILINKSL